MAATASILQQTAVYLGSAVIAVPICSRLGPGLGAWLSRRRSNRWSDIIKPGWKYRADHALRRIWCGGDALFSRARIAAQSFMENEGACFWTGRIAGLNFNRADHARFNAVRFGI